MHITSDPLVRPGRTLREALERQMCQEQIFRYTRTSDTVWTQSSE